MKLVTLLQNHLLPHHIPWPKIETFPSFPIKYHQTHLPIRSFHLTTASDHVKTVNPFLFLLGSCTDMDSLGRIHGLFVVHGLTGNLPCQTKLVSIYGSFGDVEQACMVFDRIPSPDLYSWKVMIRWYFMWECYFETIGFYRHMKGSVREQDDIVFSLVVKSCTKLLDLHEGRKLHCDIIKVANPTSFVLTGLLDMYAKCGEIECSRRLFDEIPERNVVSWTSIISGYVQNDRAEEGLVLFNQMRQVPIEPNEFTKGSLLTACSKLGALHQGKWIHSYMLKDGMDMNCFVATALLDMYVKCGEVTDARSIFDELYIVDLIPWTAMIVGYTQKGFPFEALKLFSDKKWARISPNSVTIASALSASSQLRDLNLGRSIHTLGIKLGLEEDVVIKNALVDIYAKCCEICEANYVFERIPQKDIVAWNAMIAGYSQNGFGYEALLLFHRMRSYGCLPDAITVVSALSACVCLGDMCHGSSFHNYAIKFGFLSNVYVGTALLNLYNKCGDVESARCVFNGMSDRNAVAWCAMIGGCGMQGNSVDSIDLFDKMVKENLQPNDVIFTSILSACSHTGMVGEGQKYFNSMGQNYSIIPSMKHYACMVDMLARAGRLEEALKFIERMPLQADVSVWGAFLHGCRLHSRLEIGEVAVRRMMELQPETADYYVLMSNLYASDGRWDEAAKIRKLMKQRGLNKLPGHSSVEMDSMLHPVPLKDISHPHELVTKSKMFFEPALAVTS